MSTSEVAVSDIMLSERQRWLLAGLPLSRTHYELDGEALQRVTGILSPVRQSVPLSQIRNIAMQQTRWQKRWELATIQVATGNPLMPELVIRNIRNGALFEERLRRCVERQQPLQPHATV